MVRRLVGTILTTNFDSLMAEALRDQNPKPPAIVEIKTPDDRVTFGLGNDFQIVYLHGSVEHYRDQNLRQETERLDAKLVQKIRPLLNDAPLVVIGYPITITFARRVGVTMSEFGEDDDPNPLYRYYM